MKRVLALAVAASLVAIIGCSDDNPVKPKDNRPANTATSTWNDSGFWRTTVDASSTTVYKGFSFTTKDTTTSSWDIAFRRDVVKLDGGASTTTGGDATGANLGVVAFSGVTLGDTAGTAWTADAIEYFINNWYDYNPISHSLTANRNVYSMVDAEGDNYVKFQIDSLVGAAQPPNMGTVYLKYYYQPTAASLSLNGATTSISIPVNSGTAYFDFSSGTVVTPADPTNSTEWDIAFSAYDLKQNCGPNGTGHCAAFYAYTELVDPTNIDGFTAQPNGAPLFPDVPSSVFTDWYNYTGPPLHQLLTKGNVYLVKVSGKVYSVKIESYYSNVGGVPTSGWYTFVWKEL